MIEETPIEETPRDIVEYLWAKHRTCQFPKGVGGKDVNGIDFDMLDSDVAGCVLSYLDRQKLDVRRTAILGLSYHHCEFIVPILNEEAAAYYWRLGRIAELVLKELAKSDNF